MRIPGGGRAIGMLTRTPRPLSDRARGLGRPSCECGNKKPNGKISKYEDITNPCGVRAVWTAVSPVFLGARTRPRFLPTSAHTYYILNLRFVFNGNRQVRLLVATQPRFGRFPCGVHLKRTCSSDRESVTQMHRHEAGHARASAEPSAAGQGASAPHARQRVRRRLVPASAVRILAPQGRRRLVPASAPRVLAPQASPLTGSPTVFR